MAVYNELGCGFLEPVYQEALEHEFKLARIPYRREALIPIHYKGTILKKNYFADFICYEKIIVELKAVSEIAAIHKMQVKNYLKAAGLELGIIANFGSTSLETVRVCNSNNLLLK